MKKIPVKHSHRLAWWILVVVLCGAWSSSCVEQVPALERVIDSFKVELLSVEPSQGSPLCAAGVVAGSKACPHFFPTEKQSVTVTLRARALDRHGVAVAWDGAALVDVRPGMLLDVGPQGLWLQFEGGVSNTVRLDVAHLHGEVRFWVEDCGRGSVLGSFASGVSAPMYFQPPRITDLNAISLDNTSSPMLPRVSNHCALRGDPRFGFDQDEKGKLAYVGYSHERSINAPPPAIANFVEMRGCPRATWDALRAEGRSCQRGPLVVTAVSSEGFYVTDLHPAAVAAGFNSLYVFNFSYPEGLEVGDILTLLRGSPVEFSGTTQLGNPFWRSDGHQKGIDLLPAPVTISASELNAALRSDGGNRRDNVVLERLENAVVCMDGLLPASRAVHCDVNQSGAVQRSGCLTRGSQPPPLCEQTRQETRPTPPRCDAASEQPYCLDFGHIMSQFDALESPQHAVERCFCAKSIAGDCQAFSRFVRANPIEYCCEKLCYGDPTCTEASTYILYGQWVATAPLSDGINNDHMSDPKIAIMSRHAAPSFDPLALGAEGQHRLRVIGNLRHVLAARPVWMIVPRKVNDIAIDGVCPDRIGRLP